MIHKPQLVRSSSLLLFLSALLATTNDGATAGLAQAQTSAPHHASIQPSNHSGDHSTKAAADQSDLGKRISAANAAREAGDPAAVTAANQLLIAAALREVAQLRSLEAAYPQAIDLYKRSLFFEDSTQTRTDLAFAELEAGRFDEALAEADKATAVAPRDQRADQVRAAALMQKGDYARAAEAFTRLANAEPEIPTLYSLAICLLATRKPEDKQRAVGVFQQMQKQAGESGSLHVLFGRAYRDAEDMASAVREFQRAVELDSTTPHAHYFLGLALLALNEWKPTAEAEMEMKKELQHFPHDYLANYMLGFLNSAERRYEESDRYLTTASEINPSAPEPFLYMGLNAYAQDHAQRAEEMLRKAVVLTGKDEARSNYQIRRAYVDLGRILSNSGRTDEAAVFLTKARDLQNKTMEQSQQNVASIALAGGAGSAAAVVPLARAQENQSAPLPASQNSAQVNGNEGRLLPAQRNEVDARDKELHRVLGLAFSDLATSLALRREYAQALAYYQQAGEWDASVPGLNKNLGQSAFRAGNYPEAIRGLSTALEHEPDATALRAMLGMAYFATNQYAQAAKTFDPLGARGMTDAEIGYAWAASLTHLADTRKAATVLAAFQSEPRSEDSLLLIGQLWTEIGDYANAIASFSKALESNPSLAKAHFDAGLAYIHWERWSDAAREFQAELALNPEDPDAQYHLGFVYKQQSQLDQAVACFQKVIEKHPDYANAQYELGKILLDRGKTADAVTHLEMAAQLNPQMDYLHYQLQAAYRKEDRIAEADHELEIYKQLKAKARARAADATKAHP